MVLCLAQAPANPAGNEQKPPGTTPERSETPPATPATRPPAEGSLQRQQEAGNESMEAKKAEATGENSGSEATDPTHAQEPTKPPRETGAAQPARVDAAVPLFPEPLVEPPVEPLAAEDALRRARNEYAYGNYDKAVRTLSSLLYPMALSTDAQVIEARQYLALSYYLTERAADAREEFAKLLFVDPDFQLDPYAVAPPVIEMFEEIRSDLREQLDVIRHRRSEAKLQEPQRVGFKRIIETTVTEKSDIATLLPFGVGQFQNGQTGWGFVFASLELLLLAVNIGSYLWTSNIGDYPPEQRKLVNALTVSQYASAALVGVVWSLGVFHARLHFVPSIMSPPVVRDEPLLSPRSQGGRGGLGLLFSLRLLPW